MKFMPLICCALSLSVVAASWAKDDITAEQVSVARLKWAVHF